jgi:hypothetical protein
VPFSLLIPEGFLHYAPEQVDACCECNHLGKVNYSSATGTAQQFAVS